MRPHRRREVVLQAVLQAAREILVAPVDRDRAASADLAVDAPADLARLPAGWVVLVELAAMRHARDRSRAVLLATGERAAARAPADKVAPHFRVVPHSGEAARASPAGEGVPTPNGAWAECLGLAKAGSCYEKAKRLLRIQWK